MKVDALQARSIFTEAVENHSPEGWDAFLDARCAGNPSLRLRVESLLKAHLGEDTFLDRGDEDSTRDQPVAEAPNSQIGPYKLLQQIGEGGMGAVWMAEQHEPVRRRVALKLIKPGMDSRQVLARFDAERQALSLMDHPNIAKVIDAGTTDTGRPYFVMELVKGQPITEYCDQQRLSPRERLQLFLPICQAIQHAHQKGIIHRDIKPSNLLVAEYDGHPVAKVIDFGVAKAIHRPLTEKTMFTGFGQIIGTLEYMSPEQARLNQLDVDTRSDVYSLGVLLYELLTGTAPFDSRRLNQAALEDLLRIIREEEPQRPSLRVSSSETLPSIAASRRTQPQRLPSMLRRELDWVILKAMEKDRNRRYESASALAEDISRYLDDQRVLACPPSVSYRVSKTVRRHRGAIAFAAVLGMILVGATVFSLSQASRAQRAAAQARLSEVETDKMFGTALGAVEELLEEVGRDTLANSANLQPLRANLLSRAAELYEQLARESRSSSLRARHRNASALVTLGEIQLELGQYEPAQRSLEEAQARLQSLVDLPESNADMNVGLARSHRLLGELQSLRGDNEQATLEYQQALQQLTLVSADERAFPEWFRSQSEALVQLGLIYLKQGQIGPARGSIREAVRVAHQIVEQGGSDPDDLFSLAKKKGDLARIEFALGSIEEGLEESEQAIAIDSQLVGRFPERRDYRRAGAIGRSNHASFLFRLDRIDEAVEYLKEASRIHGSLTEDYPSIEEYKIDHAQTLNLLGVIHAGMREIPQATAAYEQAESIMSDLAQSNPDVPQYQSRYAAVLQNIAVFRKAIGEYDKSLELLRTAIEYQQAAIEAEPDNAEFRQFEFNHHYNVVLTLSAQADAAKCIVAFDALISRYRDHSNYFDQITDLANQVQVNLSNAGLQEEAKRVGQLISSIRHTASQVQSVSEAETPKR